MTLLAPLSLLWLSLLIPLVVLYILKRRRREQVVGSTLLWEAALRDLRAERPFRRLLLHLALILQALALITGALALARPASRGDLDAGVRLAVVIDVSPSMAARDDEVTRIDQARRLATTLAEGLPPEGEMMIIEAGAQPAVLSAFTNDVNALLRALDSLHVHGRRADLDAATDVAAERLHEAPAGSRLVVITDRAFDGELHLEALPVETEVRTVGSSGENTAIVAAGVRPASRAGSVDDAELFVRLERFGKSAADVYLTASIEGGGLVASRRLRVNPDEPEAVVLNAALPPDTAGRAALVTVELTHDREDVDALDLDDVVVIPSPGSAKLPVFLVGPPPRSVKRVLQADPMVELFETDLETLAAGDSSPEELDGLLIFTGSTPDEPTPGDSVVIIPAENAEEPAKLFGLELGAPVEAARVTTWDEQDAKLRFVALANITLGTLRPLKGAAGRSLIETTAGTAAAVLAHHRGEVTVLAFDPSQGGWSRDPSFVIFFRNLLEGARRRRLQGGIPPDDLGEPLRVAAADGTRVEVVTPSGDRMTARSRGGVALVSIPPEPGAFHVDVGSKQLYGLRSLRNRQESDLRPRGRILAGDRPVEATTATVRTHRERWPYVVFVLLLFLVAECLVATRRVT